MTKIHTLQEAADMIGAAYTTIKKYAAIIKAPKYGRSYMLYLSHIKKIAGMITQERIGVKNGKRLKEDL